VSKSIISLASGKETPVIILNAAENPPSPSTSSHDDLASTDYDPDSRLKLSSLETPSKSQGNIFSIILEEMIISSHENKSDDDKHMK
jgi:hypothetical protein